MPATAHRFRALPLSQRPSRRSPARTARGKAGVRGMRSLPPALVFFRNIEVIRGHLLVGNDNSSRAGRWADALPHFLHPTEEIYGGTGTAEDLRHRRFRDGAEGPLADRESEEQGRLREGARDREGAARRGPRRARAPRRHALGSLRARHGARDPEGRDRRIRETPSTASASSSRSSIRIPAASCSNPSGSSNRSRPNSARRMRPRFAAIRAAFADLKKAWPEPVPPKNAVKDLGEVLSDISKIELQSGKFN